MVAFDPVFSPEDKDLLISLGVQIFPENRVSVAFNLFRELLSSVFLFGFTFRQARSYRIFDFDIFFPLETFLLTEALDILPGLLVGSIPSIFRFFV